MHPDSLSMTHLLTSSSLSAESPLKQIDADSVRAGELSWVARTKGQVKFLVLEETLWTSISKQWGCCWKWHRCTQNTEHERHGTQNNIQNYWLGPISLPEIVKVHTRMLINLFLAITSTSSSSSSSSVLYFRYLFIHRILHNRKFLPECCKQSPH